MKPRKYLLSGYLKLADHSTPYLERQMDALELGKVKKIMNKLVYTVFDFLKHPQITYRERRLVYLETEDKAFIKNVFNCLYLNFASYGFHPILKVIRHYERHYWTYERLHRRRPISNFYLEAVKHLFFYVYEANNNLTDDQKRDAYLQRFV